MENLKALSASQTTTPPEVAPRLAQPSPQVMTGRLPPLGMRFPVVGSALMFGVALAVSVLSGIDFLPFFIIVACVLGAHVTGNALLRRGLWPNVVNPILRVINLTAYTMAILLSDGLSSPLIPLYVEDILSASLRHGRRGAWKGWGLVTAALLGVALGTWPLSGAEINRLIVYDAVMAIVAMIAGELGQQRLEIHTSLAQQMTENARLYAELQERTQHLNAAYDELQELDCQKTALVQSVSHELRTPLLFIRGYIELMLEGSLGQLTDLQREKLKVVAGKTELLVDLVRDIVSLQRGQPPPDEMIELSLTELTRQAVSGAEALACEQGIRLCLDLPDDALVVRGNARRLTEIFDNLLSNATKFSPDGGVITLSACRMDGVAQVAVADEGIGIPPAEHERIFERFYQVDSTITRRFEGTGLGLAIVKQIVEGHGGQVWVHSPTLPNASGSTFYFTIPLADAKSASCRTSSCKPSA